MEITRESNQNNSKLYTWSEKIKETNKEIYLKSYNVRELLNTRN